MTPTPSSLLERLLPVDQGHDADRDEPHQGRLDAQAWLREHGLPSARDEAWKYTPLSDILTIPLGPAAARPARLLDAANVDALAGNLGGPRLVFVNGEFSPRLSHIGRLQAGLRCGGRALGPSSPRGAGRTEDPSRFDGFQALNQVASRDRAVVLVAPDTDATEPVHVVHLQVPGDAPTVSHPRTFIGVGAASHLTVIETYAGLPGRGLTNAVTEIDVAADATLVHHKVQAEATDRVHLAHTSIRQADRSEVRSYSFMLGADIARDAVDATLVGPDATVALRGLYLPIGTQRHDIVTVVEHAASGGRSRQLFKGVVDDHARGSFSGRIIVQPDTIATDADQTSRSLLLAPTAEADTRPWLEIFADDVRCTHGATVGRLDDEALFYFRTRGINERDARTMLIAAFIDELTTAIQPDALRRHLGTLLAAKSRATKGGRP
jgi:Fe-S cluster assembly protein SufD